MRNHPYRFLYNKYLLATVGFLAWVLFFDRNDFFTQRQRKAELESLESKIEYYQQQAQEARQELNNLRNDPAMLEKYARERYFMKRDNEDVFVFEE
ncbi:MAG TPA: septum formation initiator family protein [Phnomibacter sp.]|nr:septum formation initiator family protein [Phnomibacter sp.]